MKLEAFVPFVTYPEANADVFAAHAVSLASSIGASLHAAAINADIPDVSNALSKWLLDTPALIRQAEERSRQRGGELLASVKEKAAAAGVEVSTGSITAPIADLGDVAATQARYYDLSFVGWEADNATSAMVAEAVVFGSGKPAILLPEQREVAPFDHIAIAWDGSRVAARALADARLFLESASQVSVITVHGEKPLREKDAAERLAGALRARGVSAEAVPVNGQGRPIAETLQGTATERGAQLLVMGGYGHSRIRDFVLGGATQGVLNKLALPVLLSH